LFAVEIEAIGQRASGTPSNQQQQRDCREEAVAWRELTARMTVLCQLDRWLGRETARQCRQ
jgi:hypothetical protein